MESLLAEEEADSGPYKSPGPRNLDSECWKSFTRKQKNTLLMSVRKRDMLLVMLLRLAVPLVSLYDTASNAILPRLILTMRLALLLEIAVGCRMTERSNNADSSRKLFSHALVNLGLTQPVAIQLIRPTPASKRLDGDQPSSLNPDLSLDQVRQLQALTEVPNYPQPAPVNPVFGHTSLPQAALVANSDSMDWEPSPGAAVSNGGWTRRPPAMWDVEDDEPDPIQRNDWDSFAINKQRMFAQPQAQETGLESLLAGWGLGGGGANSSDDVSSTFSPSAIGQKHGFFLDEASLRIFNGCLFLARCSGTTLSVLPARRSLSEEGFSSANRTLLGIEITTGCLGLLMISYRYDDSAKSSVLKLAVVALIIVLRCLGLFAGPPIPTMFVALQHRQIQPSIEWAIWAVVDFVSIFL